MKKTIRLIGKAIRDGALYLPIRHLAGRAAAVAPPKNYYAQIRSIYDAITKQWWRYTYDPKGAEVLTVDPKRIFEITLGRGNPNHIGYGDCDDIATASGALLRSIGMDLAICTTVKPGSPFIFDHVFLMVKPPKGPKWIPFDPVLYPHKGCGDITKFQRLALWDLNGKLISRRGPFPPRFTEVMALYGSDRPAGAPFNPSGAELEKTMNTQNPSYHDFYDYGEQMGLFGEADTISPSAVGSDQILPDFATHGIVGFGCYGDVMGSITGEQCPRIMAEYDGTDEIGDTGLVRTKHFEMAPDDYAKAMINGVPDIGALALADDGEVYQWVGNPDGLGGFFKKLFKKARKKIRKVAKRVKGIAKKFVKRLPGGSLIWKIGSKIHRTAMKLVKPLLKVVGPLAKKIAPVAALIPGIGPAVSAGLMITGKAYDIAKKFGVKFDSKNRPQIQSKGQGRAFARALAKAGRAMGKGRARRAIAAFKRRRGGGLFGEADVYSNPAGTPWRTSAAYEGIGWI